MSEPVSGAGFSGMVAPLPTPLEDQDRLDVAGLERLVEHVIGGGVQAIFVLGTTGEAPSLSYRLRREVLQSCCTTARRRVPVFVGITDTAFVESVNAGRAAADAGAAAVVVAPPYYAAYSQDDLARYIERLASELPLPIFLYNFPQLTKIEFGIETIRRLAQSDRVIGLKDSSGDMRYFEQVLEAVRTRSDFSVLMGREEMLVDAIRLGARGGVCGGANLFPSFFVNLCDLARVGRWEEAGHAQAIARELSSLLYTVGDESGSYLRGLKAGLACLSICSDLPALPLSPFSSEERRVVAGRVTSARAALQAALPALAS